MRRWTTSLFMRPTLRAKLVIKRDKRHIACSGAKGAAKRARSPRNMSARRYTDACFRSGAGCHSAQVPRVPEGARCPFDVDSARVIALLI